MAAGAVVATALVLAVFIGATCYRPGVPSRTLPAEVQQAADAVPGYVRAGSSTYLTVPEWYIVYSTEEYAAHIASRPPSAFPYFRTIAQFWRYYAAVCRATRDRYPFDPGAHLMLAVIGVSFSVEHALKGVWETTLGRLTELVSTHRSAADRFAARTAEEYGRFMHTVPWYQFPFGARARALWAETGWGGDHPVRTWERKLVLGAEYGTKAAYAALIRLGTGAVYDAEAEQVHARLSAAPRRVLAHPRVQRVTEVAPGAWIVRLPRYEPFTAVVTDLVARGARFADIAGNDEIVLTALVRADWARSADASALVLDEPLLTDPARRRIAMTVPVRALHAILPALERHGARVEHLYDY